MREALKKKQELETVTLETLEAESNDSTGALAAFLFLGATLFFDAGTYLNWVPESIALVFRYRIQSFYVFPIVLWLAIPLYFSRKNLERKLFTFERWKGSDYLLILSICLAFGLSLPLIKIYPALGKMYASKIDLTLNQKVWYLVDRFIFTISWLPAWEFAHRGFLLPKVAKAFPRFGWWLVPLCETGYHLIKPMPELIGMFFFSVIATLWVMRRRNLMLPFIAHFLIEFLLYAYLVLI